MNTIVAPYMPILRSKQAEKGALQDLKIEERKKITPLIELLPKQQLNKADPASPIIIPREQLLKEEIIYIQQKLADIDVFLDSTPLYHLEKNLVFSILNSSTDLFGSNIIPVIVISDIKTGYFNNQSLDFMNKQGVCLRVSKEELTINFFDEIDQLLKKIPIERTKVDLLIDYGITDPNCFELLLEKLKTDKGISLWRSFYFASGAFRKDLIGLSPGNHDQLRYDWILWQKLFEKMNNIRVIGYSDYTIQHPIYKAINNPNTSFSVRYAQEDKWIIMKGQARNAKNNAGDLQYYAHSKMLVDQQLFLGTDCCKGDEYILNLSKDPNQKRGNPQKWIKVGINHHICLTLRQIAKMY